MNTCPTNFCNLYSKCELDLSVKKDDTVTCLGTETPFGFLICFITILHIVTSITFYTVTHLHSLQSLHANIPF
jgi:hypothetical protein